MIKPFPSDRIGKDAKAKKVKSSQCDACGAWFEFKSAHKCDRLILALVRSAERKLKKRGVIWAR